VSDGAYLRDMSGHLYFVNSIAFSPNGANLLSGGSDSTAKLWRVSDASLLQDYDIETGSEVFAAAYSPDGASLAYGRGDGTVVLAANPYQAAAATSLSALSVTGRIGQTVALSATLTSGGSPVAGETVTFEVAGTTAGGGTTNASGIATYSYAIPESLGTGGKTIEASFAGDTGYASSTGSNTLTVTKGNVAFSQYAASGSPGQAVSLRTLIICGGKAVIGRTVKFSVDGGSVGSAVSDSAGATLPYTIPSSMALGAHNVTVSFDGDAAYNAASRTTAALTVFAKVSFSQYAATGAPGQAITLKTLVYSGGKPVSGLPIQFTVDSTVAGTATSDATCAALPYTIPASMAVGPHNVTVSFAGNASYTAASNTIAALTVVNPKANVSFSQYAASGAPGQIVTLKTLVISGGKPVSGLPIQFTVDSSVAGTATSDATCAALSYTIPPSMTAGVHNVTVSFAGNASYNAASRTSAALTVTVPKANVTFSLYTVSGFAGQTVTLKSLVYSGGSPAIGLTVQFAVDGNAAGSATSDASGVSRSYTIPAAMPTGAHNVTVTFAGDATHNAATRTSSALTVK
jgi:large repetitive protein